MSERLLADAVVLLHGLFIVFAVAGGLLVLRWPRLAWLHLPAAVWGVLVELNHWMCPLTPVSSRTGVGSGSWANRTEVKKCPKVANTIMLLMLTPKEKLTSMDQGWENASGRQRIRPSQLIEHRLLRIEPHAVVHGRVDVDGIDGVHARIGADGVGRAVHDAAPDAAAGE